MRKRRCACSQTEIAQTSIVAPFDGVVTQRLLDPGAYASPNTPVVRVSQIDTVYVNVNVPDDDLAYVHRATPVTFTTSSLPNKTYSAQVMDVNATPTQGTLSYRARVRVVNPNDLLRGGMLVAVTVRKEFHPSAIVVPRAAVFQTESGANVFIVTNLPPPHAGAPGSAPAAGAGAPAPAQKGPPVKLMQAKVVPVQVGLQTDTQAEVRSPEVKPGTTVITTRPDALRDSSTVAISGTAAAPRGAQ